LDRIHVSFTGQYQLGVSDQDAQASIPILEPQEAKAMQADCPSFLATVRPFALSTHPVTKKEFADFWFSRARKSLKVRRTDREHWKFVLSMPSYSDDAPIVGLTHAEAAAYARYIGGRVPFQHELEIALRGPAGPAQLEAQSTWLPDNFDEMAVSLPPVSELPPVGAAGVRGLAGYIRSLCVLSDEQWLACQSHRYPTKMPLSTNAIKVTSGADRCVHFGTYIFYPDWVFYIGRWRKERMRLLNPPGLWVAFDS
jgi:formylglycine-generating enzyme required for sulfatase activity